MTGGADRTANPGTRVLLILLLAYIFNFVDRQIIGILAVPIKAELGLSNTQLGLMGGLAFALFYSGLAIPIAWLADRRNRVKIIAGSVALWSIFTAACGLAQNFWQLFLARMGVGIGEAGGVAPSYALISDLYPREKRGRAFAFFSLGIPIGSALGILFGGWIASQLDWRSAFLIVGLAGLPVALLVRFCIREPERGRFDRAEGTTPDPAVPLMVVAKVLAKKPSFWLLSFGAASGSILGYGLIFWLPSFFSLSFDMAQMDPVMNLLPAWFTGGADPKLLRIAVFYGSIVLVGGIAGTWLGGWLGDRTGPSNPASYARIPAICFAIALPVFALGLFAPTLWLGWLLFTFGQMLGLAWLGPVIAAVQHIVPPAMRATASASFLFINNLIGIGFGTFFFGFMSDRMGPAYGDQALKYSILYGLGFYGLSALFYFVASRRLAKDWVA